MAKCIPLAGVGVVLLAIVFSAHGAATSNNANAKDTSKSSTSAKPQAVLSTASPVKSTLKRETLPLPSSKSVSGGKSGESLRTASQTLFGYNGGNGYNSNGFQGQFGGFSPNYAGGNQGGFNQYQQGFGGASGAYNVLGAQGQTGMFAGQGQGPYYSGAGNYFGSGFGGGSYPYATSGGSGAYPFASQGGFGGFGGGFGNSGYYPGAQFQGQLGQRNFGFVNQGFGNPAFRNPQAGIATSSGISGIPSSVQVGTGLEVGQGQAGSRGFTNTGGSLGGFPSASGQQYIVGNGIGAPAFIGGGAGVSPGTFGFGGPYGGMYSSVVPGGLYRQQSPNSIFGPYDYTRRPLSGTPTPSSRPSSVGATRLQTTGPNRFYQGVSPAGTYSSSSRDRLYRYTSSDN